MEDKTTNLDWQRELVDLLTELSTVQDDMFRVLTQRRDRMVQSEVEGLEDLETAEQELAGRLESCHRRRSELLERAAKEGLPADSIRQLASALPESKQGKLGKQVNDTSARMRLLQHHSLTNWVLAQRSLLHLSQLLEIIATGGRLKPTYGEGEPVHSRGSLVDQAA